MPVVEKTLCPDCGHTYNVAKHEKHMQSGKHLSVVDPEQLKEKHRLAVRKYLKENGRECMREAQRKYMQSLRDKARLLDKLVASGVVDPLSCQNESIPA